ncbi:unnamed protein product (macronuclear) [Paramecium tetraurelia]|uniref:Uncharacterized protein n=1 Tax=Paramecium tetraurelia TaxID=5888 RepID=A0DXC0_PARTE|nr:uncharacterized protein GSPATT00021320001 [Paramecium tetraurelia]CAK87687.1 unnamed protein product [Paramecium tetraurelia]|eukprot:XP_001455084.1 hypothetical protein (macronuclear) [Paramecium tetraurelia strain d4-2]
MNDQIFQEMKSYIHQSSLALIAEYRLLYLNCQQLAFIIDQSITLTIKLIEDDMDSKQRFEEFAKANMYFQCRYSGRHNFSRLEYIHLNPMPIVLIKVSSFSHRSCHSMNTFNVFSHKDFKEKFSDLLDNIIIMEFSPIIDNQGIIQVKKAFNSYATKTEGVTVEVKESSIRWQVKNQEDYAQKLIQDLQEDLQTIVV